MSTVQLLFILIAVFIAFAALIVWFFSIQIKSLKEQLSNNNDEVLVAWLRDMKGSVDKTSDTLASQLKDHRFSLETQLKMQRDSMQEQTKVIWERLDNASKVIGAVHQHLGGIQEFGKDIKDLSNVLKSPKLRGGLGEQFLYEILANCLPKDLYKTQYRFSTGTICDAVVKTDSGLIPIDSKFPMENFKAMVEAETVELRDRHNKLFIKDVKNRIDEIATKYLLPEEGTIDHALMYIPSESVYYELIVNTTDIEDYAKHKNVVMASPNTLSYFLKVLLVAFQQHELEKHAGEILKALAGIKIEAEKFDTDLGVLDGHLNRASKSMGAVRQKYSRLVDKIENVSAMDAPKEPVKLPELDSESTLL